MANSAWSILVGVELETTKIKSQLKEATKGLKVSVDAKDAVEGIDNLDSSIKNASLSFQAANEVFSTTIDIISAMTEQVFELDTALTEFKKVSDLSGTALDNYVDKLSTMGSTVARTGKPKCLTPNVGMVNQH